jgi:hypothetical protein
MDCRTALETLECDGTGLTDVADADVKAAEAHLSECPRCQAILEGRRQLDRKIGRVMRSVEVPAGAKERLVAQLVDLESGATASFQESVAAVATPVPSAAFGEAVVARPINPTRPARRVTSRLLPIAACVALAAIGFFSVIWLMTPRWTVAEVRQQLAQLDFGSLDSLREFRGDSAASQLPADLNWQKLDWSCHKIAKGWPGGGGHQFAVYGFVLPGRQHHAVRGLLAVIPRGQMRLPPDEQSLLTAQFVDYLSAQIGESVSVAWTEDNEVYVCVIEGGEESLNTLLQILGPSAA